MGFPDGSMVKYLPASAGEASLIPGSGRSPGEGNGNPLKCQIKKSRFHGQSHEQRSLTGYSPWGRRRVRNDLVSVTPTVTSTVLFSH